MCHLMETRLPYTGNQSHRCNHRCYSSPASFQQTLIKPQPNQMLSQHDKLLVGSRNTVELIVKHRGINRKPLQIVGHLTVQLDGGLPILSCYFYFDINSRSNWCYSSINLMPKETMNWHVDRRRPCNAFRQSQSSLAWWWWRRKDQNSEACGRTSGNDILWKRWVFGHCAIQPRSAQSGSSWTNHTLRQWYHG